MDDGSYPLNCGGAQPKRTPLLSKKMTEQFREVDWLLSMFLGLET